MSGIEENENSRFIDYTCASKFESLCFDFEKIFKIWKRDGFSGSGGRSVFKYELNKYVLSGFDEEGEVYRESLGRNLCNDELKKWFGVNRYVILTTDGHWINLTQSTRQTLCSALLIAVQSSEFYNFPVFIANVDISKITVLSRQIYGYQLTSLPGVLCSTSYESHVINNVNGLNEVYYLDGFLKLFLAKYSQFSHQTIDPRRLRAQCKLIEEFRYSQPSGTYIPYLLSQGTLNPLAETASKTIRLFWMFFLDYRPSSSSVAELSVSVRFDGAKPGTFVDNRQYTTFLPSQQSPLCWSLRPLFKPLSNVGIKRNIIDGQLYTTSSTLASGLRRLLAFFIYARHCCPNHLTMAGLRFISKSSTNRLQYSEHALPLTIQLSDQTKLIVEEMCSKINRSTPAPAPDLFLPIIFSNDMKSENVEHGQVNTKDISMLELLGAGIAGLSVDMQSVSEMWLLFLQALREESVNQEHKIMNNELLPTITSSSSSSVVSTTATDDKMNIKPIDIFTMDLWKEFLNNISMKNESKIFVPNPMQSIIIQGLQSYQLYLLAYIHNFNIITPQPRNGITLPPLHLRPLSLKDKFSPPDITLPFISGVVNNSDNMLLISDIQAFKAMKNDATLEDFLTWYEDLLPEANNSNLISSVDIPNRNDIHVIWDNNPSNSAQDQPPLFNWLTEANRVLDNLERISPATLAMELIVNFLPNLYLMIQGEVTTQYPQCVTIMKESTTNFKKTASSEEAENGDLSDEDEDNDSIVEDEHIASIYLSRQLFLLQETINSFLAIIQNESINTDHAIASSFSGKTDASRILTLLDLAAMRLERIEGYLLRARELAQLLLLPGDRSELVHKLAQQKEVVIVRSPSDAAAAFAFAKGVSRGTSDSLWTSIDGRELGQPVKRYMEILSEPLDEQRITDLPQVKHKLIGEVEGGNMMIAAQFEELDI